MKSVLVICYWFPPDSSAGVYRVLRFIRKLPVFGWSPTVIAAKVDRYSCTRYDPELLNQVPSEIEIIRVPNPDPWQAIQAFRTRRIEHKPLGTSVKLLDHHTSKRAPLNSILRKYVRTAESLWYRPDMAMCWIRPAIKAGVKAISQSRSPDVIWATAGPLSVWIVAQRVSQRTGVPYVLDLRDPHGVEYYEHEIRQRDWAKRKIRNTLYELFAGSQSIVFLFESVADTYCKAFPGAIDPKKIHIIPNGFEGELDDFAVPGGNKFTLLYTGTMSSYCYETLLRALVTLKNTDPVKAQTMTFRFVGDSMDELARQAAVLGLSDLVEISGPTSSNEITRLQREADALLVLGRPSSVKGHELVAGAKLFHYIKARRPILGILPQDETKKVLRSLGVSTVADVNSLDEILGLLQRAHDAWSKNNLFSLLPDPAACKRFSAERQTAALVRALQGSTADDSFVPGLKESLRCLQEQPGL